MITDKPWTDKEVETLKKGVLSGMSSGKVAALLKRSRNSVMGKATRMGLSFKNIAIHAILAKPKSHYSKQPRGNYPEIPDGCMFHSDDGWCGKAKDHKDYCAEHAAIVYVEPKDTKEFIRSAARYGWR